MSALAALPAIRFGHLELPLLYALVSLFIPLLLILIGAVYAIISLTTRRRWHRLLTDLTERLRAIPGYGLDQIPVAAALFAQTGEPALQLAFERLQQDQDVLYQQRWLPDPGQELTLDKLLSGSRLSVLKLRPALTLLGVGFTATLVALLLRLQLPLADLALANALIFPPLLAGLIVAVLVVILGAAARDLLQRDLAELTQSLSRRVPVFGQQTGMAQLIDAFFQYDRQMAGALEQFNATASRLAESDMANGISRSVEQVLFETVAPALREATSLLDSLSAALIQRQEQGMAELADRFAASLAASLTTHLAPISRELSQLTGTMADIRNYTDFSVRALEAVRQNMLTQQADIRTALDDLVAARSQFQSDLTSLDEQLARLTEAATRLGAAYTDHEQTLAGALKATGELLQADQKALNASLQRSSDVLQQTRDLTSLQQQIISQLAALETALHASLEKFADESATYVDRTMDQFDQGLADIVERLAQATAEIRDAIEALPGILRQNTSFR
jgi:predicted  nucleic acid-binding Zn-ribbon protein